jgi:hypothetical protein
VGYVFFSINSTQLVMYSVNWHTSAIVHNNKYDGKGREDAIGISFYSSVGYI